MRALVLCALLAGCSFPSPEFEAASTDAAIDSTATADSDATSDSSLDSTTPADTALDTDQPSDTTPTDTKPPTDTSDPCDKDGDGYKAQGGSCGGNDCDDNDPRANPSVATYVTYDATGKTHAGDWNCDGATKRQFNVNQNCGILGGKSCAEIRGFTGDPTCGTSGKYIECAISGALCVESTSTTRIQGCF